MKLTLLQISFGISLLAHGVALGVVYWVRHGPAVAERAPVSESAREVPIVVVSGPERGELLVTPPWEAEPSHRNGFANGCASAKTRFDADLGLTDDHTGCR